MTTQGKKIPQDHLRSRKKPVRKTLWIPGDVEAVADLVAQKDELVRERGVYETMISKAASPDSSLVQKLEDIKDRIAEAEQFIKDGSIKFVLQAMPRKEFDSLPDQHKPTAEQINAAKEQGVSDNLPFNPDTYPMALVTACIVEPEMDKEELAEWLSGDEWNGPEFMTLYMGSIEVNTTRRILDAGNGSSGMRFSA